jgi:acyl-CoA thioesterase
VPTPFELATAVEPLAGGRFRASVDATWSAPIGPNGGYIAAILVRAIVGHVDPAGERRLRSLTLHYLRPPQHGEIEIEVETVRSGRRFSTGRVRAFQGGKEIVAGLAALGAPGLPEAGHWAPLAPAVAPPPSRSAAEAPPREYRPESGLWMDPSASPAEIAKHVLMAPCAGAIPFSGQQLAPGEAAEAGGWVALREPQPIDVAVVALAADIWWPPSFGPLTGPALAPTIDLTVHIRADIPPAGLPDQAILGFFRTRANVAGLIDEDGQMFLADGTLLAQSRQLALLAPIESPD